MLFALVFIRFASFKFCIVKFRILDKLGVVLGNIAKLLVGRVVFFEEVGFWLFSVV